MAGHPLVLGGRVLGPGEAHQLHLVELVDADQPAGVFAVRARLAAEAGRVRAVAARQVRASRISSRWMLVTGTSAVGNEEQIVRRHVVQVVLELGELAGAGQRGAVHQIGRRHLLVAVLAGVEVEHEARSARAPAARPARAAAGTPIRRSWRPREDRRMPSDAPSSQCGRGAKSKRGRLAPGADARGWPTHRRRASRRPGNWAPRAHAGRARSSISRSRASSALTSSPDALEPGHEVVGRLLGPLPARHLLARGVPLGLERFHPHQQLASLAVELEDRVEQRPDRRVAAAQQRGAARLGILAQALEVDHALSFSAGRGEGP